MEAVRPADVPPKVSCHVTLQFWYNVSCEKYVTFIFSRCISLHINSKQISRWLTKRSLGWSENIQRRSICLCTCQQCLDFVAANIHIGWNSKMGVVWPTLYSYFVQIKFWGKQVLLLLLHVTIVYVFNLETIVYWIPYISLKIDFNTSLEKRHAKRGVLPYILESNPHPFYSFRGLKNQMRIRITYGLDSRLRAGLWKNDRAAVRAVRTIQ